MIDFKMDVSSVQNGLLSGKKSVGVIGAGAAGLATARRLKEEGYSFIVFERSDTIGGTWVFDERDDFDKFGLPIHTSMYKNLRTNLPKEIMGFPDFPVHDDLYRSYVPAQVMLNYYHDFAAHYDILQFIKFFSLVENVEQTNCRSWQITVRDVITKEKVTYDFDCVIVCNGHYHKPRIPPIPGVDEFTGQKMHAHTFRKVESFRNKRLLIIGAGPSGLDIALDATTSASHVFISHHFSDHEITTQFPENLSLKPDVKCFSKSTAVFKDGSEEAIDMICYCTGYLYDFPFLSANCNITVRDNVVEPLYKHLISIANPSLCFIGLPFYVCANSMFDLQARFFIAMLKGIFKLPTKEAMLEDLQADREHRIKLGFDPDKHAHKMGFLQGEYYDELAKLAKIEGLPPVFTEIHNESSRRFVEDLVNYRKDRYLILNDYQFKKFQ